MSEARTLSRVQLRLLLLGLFMSLGVLAVTARLGYLTLIARDSLQERGALQHQQTLKLDARRGSIRDRNGQELATSVEVESVYGAPRVIDAAQRDEVAAKVARCLGEDAKGIASRLTGSKSFVWIERKVSTTEARCLRELNLAGVGFLSESRRFYPKRNLASQVLGYVGIDNNGMAGVEYALDDEVRGEPGRRIIWTDALRRRAASRVDKGAAPGRSVYLTLDENLQFIAETELTAAMRDSRALSGIAILMRPGTGEILAMASSPSFNPNRYGDFPESHWRNRSVTDVYEPGSTFKIVAAAAALEEGVTVEDERIDCGRGSIQVAGRTIRDHRVFDVLAFRDVVANSSNVGMIRIGQRLGKDRLDAYVRAFGFGELTGVDLPAESRGILRPASGWGPVTLASISFGQEISVTPLQMVTAVNAIASHGLLMRPKLVLGHENADGSFVWTFSPEPVRRVVSEETASRLTAILERVVTDGTGRRAAIPGYRVAGKTGTAQKAVRGGYSETDYIASFGGFAPVEDPELTGLVILDSPEGDHSGSRAAAVFGRIMERALRYLDAPRNDETVLRVAQVWPQTRPILEAEAVPARAPAPGVRPVRASMAASEQGANDVDGSADSRVASSVAPAVTGLPARDALARFVASGIVPEIFGTGIVIEQEPGAGEPFVPGVRARLVLGGDSLLERRREEGTSMPVQVALARDFWFGSSPE